MKRIEEWFETRDGVRLARTSWSPDAYPAGEGVPDTPYGHLNGALRGGVLLIHGMAEHRRRYESLSAVLAEAGYVVWGYDQRGHGETAPDSSMRRHIAPGDSWDVLVSDAREMLGALSGALPDSATMPLFVIGHSMGSLVARDLLTAAPVAVCGAVLIGTAGPGGARTRVGLVLAAAIAKLRPPQAPSRLLNTLSFGSYNRAVGQAVTEFDWLSRDREEVRRYLDDPYCGEVMSAHFFRELARGSARVNDRRAFAATPAETAVLLISGDADPVGENGEGVRTVSRRLEETGHDNVELRLYEGARHELLHETNRDEVREDILRWIDETGAACQKHGHQEE